MVSPEHARSLVWADDQGQDDVDMEDDDDDDRLFTFEVAKTNEQDENVEARQGFEVRLSDIILPHVLTFPVDRFETNCSHHSTLIPSYRTS